MPVKRASLAWLELGGRRTPDVPAEFALEPKGSLADPYARGNVGGLLLRPFVLSIDDSRNRRAFQPRP